MATRIVSFTTTVALIAVLSGCAAESHTNFEASSTVTPTVSATPTAMPEPIKPELSELVASPEGLGPILIGQPLPPGNPEDQIIAFQPQACEWARADQGEYADTYDAGRWVANYDVDTTQNDGVGPFGIVVDESGVLQFIAIFSSEILTAAGAYHGMTRDDLLALYPTGLEQDPSPRNTEDYRLSSSTGDLVFSIWETGDGVPTVNQINIVPPGYVIEGYTFGLWGACHTP